MPAAGRETSRGRGIFFELLNVAVLDLLHQCFATEKIGLEIGRELAGHDEKLVVDDFGKRNGAACGNEMSTPLEDEAGVPESGNYQKGERGGESGAAGAEELSGAIEENGEAENEKRGERNEKAVAVGRDAGPIGVARNDKMKSEKGGEKWKADAALPPPENKKSSNGKKKNGRPGEKTVIRGKKHGEEARRKPVPIAKKNKAGLE